MCAFFMEHNLKRLNYFKLYMQFDKILQCEVSRERMTTPVSFLFFENHLKIVSIGCNLFSLKFINNFTKLSNLKFSFQITHC